MNIKIGILNVPKHDNKHDLIHHVTYGSWLVYERTVFLCWAVYERKPPYYSSTFFLQSESIYMGELDSIWENLFLAID